MYQKVFELHADLLKALAHPKRLEIIQLLRDASLSVTDIQNMLDLPQANLSQHLQVLRLAGVVVTHKEGKQIYYRLAHKNFVKACDLMRQILIERHRDDQLADELVLSMSDLVPLVTDPVCGMRLSPKTAAFAEKLDGHIYYFCASGCLHEFINNPRKYKKNDNGKSADSRNALC